MCPNFVQIDQKLSAFGGLPYWDLSPQLATAEGPRHLKKSMKLEKWPQLWTASPCEKKVKCANSYWSLSGVLISLPKAMSP